MSVLLAQQGKQILFPTRFYFGNVAKLVSQEKRITTWRSIHRKLAFCKTKCASIATNFFIYLAVITTSSLLWGVFDQPESNL